MSTPVIENIAVNVLAAVNDVTTGNSYNQTLDAQRPKRLLYIDDTWDDLTALVIQDNEDEQDNMIGAYNIQDVIQSFSIAVIVISSDRATVSIDTRINQVDADIKKQLMVDATRGGYAVETIIKASERFTFNEAFSGVVVNIDVKYRIKSNDPYTQG